MSVSAPATRPPVQDSAVAIVSLRIRQRSSSARERARASLPPMLFAPTFMIPGEADGRARGGGNTFLAASEPEPRAGGRLDRHARDIHTGDLGDACAHGVAQRANFGPLADQRDLEIGDPSATRGDALDGVFEELVGGGALPLGVARRKMRADIAVRQ